MKRNIFIIAVVACLVVAAVYWISYVPHFYKHGAITSMVTDNKKLLMQAVTEVNNLNTDDKIINSIRKKYDLDKEEFDIQLAYVSRIDKERYYVEDWKGKSYNELVDLYGEDFADKISLFKDTDGLYACYSSINSMGEEMEADYYVKIDNKTLNRVFNDTDVRMIQNWTDRVYFSCYEKFKQYDMEYADFYYYKSGEPDPPTGFYAKTKNTENGWLYKSKYSMYYLEKITGQFYYVDMDGHDAV